jgi:hypothetical protein
MVTTIASIVAGAIGVGIILIGVRFLSASQTAAAGFGLPVETAGDQTAWLHAKGVRDIASGIFLWLMLANGAPHLLGAFMVAASLIPVGDAVIVLGGGGSRAAAFGIHGVTAAVLLAAGVALLFA